MASVRQDIADAIAVERGKGMKEAAPVEDSDDEDGNEEQRTALWEKLDRQRNASPSDISYVVIRETPYKTYRALFQWLLTREVTFASIRSALLVSGYLDTNPSPKSVYRLCHQLGIEELKRMALANFEGQLSSLNVLQELFSSNCFFYPELRAAGLRVLEKNWQDVKAGGGLDKILALIKKDSSDAKEMMEVAIDILKRV